MKTKSAFFYSICFLFLGSCSSSPVETKPEEGEYTFSHAYDNSKFVNVIEHNTKSANRYDGFVNTFQYKATILNSAVTEALLWKKSQDYQWSREKLQEERRKDEGELGAKSKVFLSFFTPINDSDNLNTARSVWKIYLESNGKRYEAKVDKVSENLVELQSLYPYHTRFNTPYLLVFDTSGIQVQQNQAKLVITGPIGTAEVEFDSLSQVIQ